MTAHRGWTWSLLLLPLAACGVGYDGADGWNAAAARAVARTAAAGQPLVVLERAGGPTGPELPWGVRQSLTTGGVQVIGNNAMRRVEAPVLIFDESRRDGEDWVVRTRRVHAGTEDTTTWRVRCAGDTCQAARDNE
jgi:hypothetical protein